MTDRVGEHAGEEPGGAPPEWGEFLDVAAVLA
jgi:hypothetical protein